MHWFLILDSHQYAFTDITYAVAEAERVLYALVKMRHSIA